MPDGHSGKPGGKHQLRRANCTHEACLQGAPDVDSLGCPAYALRDDCHCGCGSGANNKACRRHGADGLKHRGDGLLR